jgi:hypothetical protein
MEALAKAMAPYMEGGSEFKAVPSGTPSVPYVHGPGGLFGVSGLERDIIATRVQPRGFASRLPARGSVTTNPLFPYITGFQATSGDNKTNVCDDPPIAGSMKTCIQTAQFGRYEFQTRQSEVNRIGQITDRGEFTDLRLVNDPLVNQMAGLLRQQFALRGQQAAIAGADMLMRFVEVGVAFQNLLCAQVFTGNPTNNTAGGGYEEFPGLDILIGTTKVDAITNDDCPSLDSDIKAFNYDRVDDVNAANNIVNVLTYMLRMLRHNANTMNFGATTWVIVMRETLFYEITAVWPCNYMTYRCDFPNAQGVLNVESSTDHINFRDAMRNGRFLRIDGIDYEVVFDDCITEETEGDAAQIDGGEFASDIYVVPMTVRGGRQVTFWQYYDYSKGSIPAINQGRLQSFFWSDGGRYLWHAKPPTNWCVEHIAKIEPRIILQTPHLAGRVTDVKYRPLQHTRDPLPAQPYFTDGGVTTGYPPPSLYSDWNTS